MAYTDQQIRDQLAANPNASASDIYTAMQKYGVTIDQLSSATGKSTQDLANLGAQGGLKLDQLQTVGYNPQAEYDKWAASGSGNNPLSSPAFQLTSNGLLSQGTTGAITANDIRREIGNAQKTGSDAGLLTWANTNGVSAAMIDNAMGYAPGTSANYAKSRNTALYGMDGYFTGQGGDANAPMYAQARNFDKTGVLSPASQTDIDAIGSQRIGTQMTGTSYGYNPDINFASPGGGVPATTSNLGTGTTDGLIATAARTTVPLYSGFDPGTDTTRGQVNSMLQQDSEYLQNARTQAKQAANATGTLNSSMTEGAATKAAIDAAALIGDATANQYQKSKLTTQELNNRMDLALLDADTRMKVADIAFQTDQARIASADKSSVLNNYQQIASDTNQMIQAILVSPTLTPEAKQNAINQVLARHDEYINFQDGITGYNLSDMITYEGA